MSLRDIHFGVRLGFATQEERESSESVLMWLLGIVCKHNLQYLLRYPETPLLYDSGVVYTKPDQADGRPPLDRAKLKKLLNLIRDMGQDAETALMVVRLLKGIEIFLDTPALYRRGKGDCNELVPVRVAELWRAGIAASPYLVRFQNDRGGYTYHAIVKWPDGSAEDPSLILGMGGRDRAEERQEEIRKNAERRGNYMRDGQQLIDAGAYTPEEVSAYVDSLGLFPKDGVFRSPYEKQAA